MIQIKKYSNRRLYNTATSRYLNLEELAALIREGEQVTVTDASTGEDLTRAVLLQIILEVQKGESLFPPGLLHRVIRSVGDHPVERAMFQQLTMALGLLDQQIVALEERMPWLKVKRPATGAAPSAEGGPAPEQAPPPAPEPAKADDMEALRARLAELEARLKR